MKMKTLIIICLSLQYFSLLQAQDHVCDSIDFCAIVQKVEANYAGFPTKVNDVTKNDYDSLKSNLYNSVIKNGRHGYDAAAEYVAWFEDRHLFVGALSQKYMKPSINYDSINYAPKFLACSLDSNTFFIRIPSFNYDEVNTQSIKNAVNEYKKSGNDNLIIDIRGNGGGLDYTYTPLYELIYNQPFNLKGVEFRASSDVASLLRNAYKTQNGNPIWANTLADSIDTGQYEFISVPMSNEPITLDSICPLPKKVAVIIDNKVASAAEQFLILAKACSNRVTFYGKDNTLGAVDYSNLMPFDLPCSSISCYIPTSRTIGIGLTNHGIDGVGIAPDVRITLPYPDEITDNIDSWVFWIKNHMDE